MALNNNGFGFQQSTSGGGGGTNTNIANTDLTATGSRILDMDGEDLSFTSIALFSITGQTSFTGDLTISNGASAPNLKLKEASGGGTNVGTLTVGALGANRTYTFPNATGTVALTSDISNTNLGNTDLTADAARTYDTNANDVKFVNGGVTQILFEDGNMVLGGGGDSIEFRREGSGSNPVNISFYEPPNGGSNNISLVTPALASNRTITFPDATGTFSLLEADQVFTGKQNIEKREFKVPTGGLGDVDGDVLYIGTGSVQGGKVYYFNGTDWASSDADAASTATGLLGIALDSGATSTVGVLVRGYGTLGVSTGGSNGDVLYLSTGANQITSTAPSGSGDIVRVVGYLIDSTNNIVWFNPDGSWVEIA